MGDCFPDVPDLASDLRQLFAQIPPGRAATCGDLAKALGNRVAATWIGHYVLHHAHDAACPCHRIVRAGGELGGYAGGSIDDKAQKLAREGIALAPPTKPRPPVTPHDKSAPSLAPADAPCVPDRLLFRDFVSDRPLERLQEIQADIQRRIVLRPRRRIPRLVGGVDVAYPAPDVGVAAFALVDVETGGLVWSTTVRRCIVFPYITTYLSFREIPILLALLDAVRAAGRMTEIILVDGSGILHQRRAGIASHLGVVANLATVGVTKKLLCGEVEIEGMAPGESRPVLLDARPIGIAIPPTSGSRRPIFISPGHHVDVPYCDRLVRRLLVGKRLPAPIYWADRLACAEARAAKSCKAAKPQAALPPRPQFRRVPSNP
jgi:deoxyribonuclease V